MSKWEEKCWGRVYHLFQSDHAAVSYLRVNKGYQCSQHMHRERANQFTVMTGSIVVEEWDDRELHERGPHRFTTMIAGDTHTVPSGVLHRFRVLGSGGVIEVYWPDPPGGTVRLDDIERLDVGGAA